MMCIELYVLLSQNEKYWVLLFEGRGLNQCSVAVVQWNFQTLFPGFFTFVTTLIATGCLGTSVFWMYGNENVCKKLDVNAKSKAGTLTLTPLDLPQFQSLLAKVVEDVNGKPLPKKKLTLFQIKHLSPFVMGLPTKGAFCGIPLHFQWTEPSQVDLKSIPSHAIWLYGSYFTTINFDLDESKIAKDDLVAFKECLVLSEKAKKFALAQQIFPTVNYHHFVLFVLPFITIHSCFFAAFGLLKDPKMLAIIKHFKVPLAVGFALLAPVFTYNLLGTYFYNLVLRWDSFATRSLKESDYIEGGVEYLEKSLTLGKLLRQYMKFGDYYFDEDGEPITYWFDVSQVSPKLQYRLKSFKEFLQKEAKSDAKSTKDK